MTQMKKARLSTAIASALGAAAVISVPMAAMAQTPGDPIGFAPTGTGQVLIVPYYTTNGGWTTAINFTNVTDNALLVKVRFHEAQNSRDILDFNVMMSPHDVWNGYLTPGLNEGDAPLFRTDDTTCTTPEIPAEGVSLSAMAFTGGNADGGPTDNSRLSEGYIELMVIGECTAGSPCMTDFGTPTIPGDDGIGYLTKHVSGTPRDCARARTMSVADGNAGFPVLGGTFTGMQKHGGPAYRNIDGGYTGRGYGSVLSYAPLKGNISFINSVNGQGGGVQALHLDAVACNSQAAPQGRVCGNQSANLVTAQSPDYFLEPTIATMPNGLWDARSLNLLESRFTWASVVNEWADNENNAAYTDWIINFPTKGFHVDQFCHMVQANNNAWRNDGTTVLACAQDNNSTARDERANYTAVLADGTRATPASMRLAPFNNLWAVGNDGVAKSAIRYTSAIFDREEGGAVADSPIFSPGGSAQAELRFETNVIRFATNEEDAPLLSPMSARFDAQDALGNADALYGWMDLKFSGVSGTPAVNPFVGLPVYGFVMKNRAKEGRTLNYAQMMDHGYTWSR